MCFSGGSHAQACVVVLQSIFSVSQEQSLGQGVKPSAGSTRWADPHQSTGSQTAIKPALIRVPGPSGSTSLS